MKYLTLLLFLAFSPAAAQQSLAPAPLPPVLTLHEALTTALKNSLDVQVSQANAEVQELRNNAGFAGGLPTVGLTGNVNEILSNTQQEFNTGQRVTRTGAVFSQYAAGLSGSLPLYNGGLVRANRKRLNELVEIGQLQLTSAVQTVLADVSLKYYAVVQQERFIRTLQASVDVSRQKLRLIEVRQSVGLANNADRFQALLDLNAQLQTQTQQRLAADQARADLLRALTLDLTRQVAVEDTIPVDNSLRWADLENALNQNPDLLAAERQVRVSELLERAAQAARRPALTLNSGTNFSRNANSVGVVLFNQSYGPFAGLGLTLPIYAGGNNKRQVDIARLNTRTTDLQRQALQRNYRLNARKAWLSYEQQLTLVQNAEENYRVARQLLRLVQLRLEAGLSTLVDVRVAQQSFEDAGYRLVNYRYAAKSEEITLRQLGALLRP